MTTNENDIDMTGNADNRSELRTQSGQPIPRNKPWHLYPTGTKAPAHGGGHWTRVVGGWKWNTGDVFPSPGGDNMDQVILPPPEPAEPTPEHDDAHALIMWGRKWLLDGDICRCRKCGRGIHVSNKLEPLRHSSECSRGHCAYPWQQLERLIGPSVLELQLAESRKMVATVSAELAAVTKQRDEALRTIENQRKELSRLNRHGTQVRLKGQLESVTKQRDILKTALEEIATGAWYIKTCVDVIAPRALKEYAAITESDHSKVEKLLGMKIEIDNTLPPGTAIVKGGRGEC